MSQSLPNVKADMSVCVLSAFIVAFIDIFAWQSRRPALSARTRLSVSAIALAGPWIFSRLDVWARPSCSSFTRTSPVFRKTPGRDSRTEPAVRISNGGSEAFARHTASSRS